jgi:hypothetical protein
MSHLIVQVAQPPSKISKLRCCDEVVVKVLNHYACELDVLVFHDTISHCAVDLLSAQSETQLPNDEIASSLKQPAVRTKQLQEVNHE